MSEHDRDRDLATYWAAIFAVMGCFPQLDRFAAAELVREQFDKIDRHNDRRNK